jgi:hypothetical protein
LLAGTKAEDMENKNNDIDAEKHIEAMNPVELNNINHANEKIEYVKNGSAAIYLKTTGILVMLLGLIVSVLNIIFIYFGMNSNWYTGNIGILKVISVGEGIIAGIFYIIISLIVLFYLSKKVSSAVRMIIICNVFLLVISFTLSIVNGCQIGMVQTFFPDSFKTEQEVTTGEQEKKDQMAVLGVQVVAHMMVLVIAAADMVGATKLFNETN